MFITTFRFGDTFVLTDERGRMVSTITMRQRKGQNQIGIEAPGLKITKQPQDEENHGNSNKRH